MNKKICEAEKNPEYGRHQISRQMLIEAPITKENFFRETYGWTYRRNEAEGRAHMSC